MQKTVYEDFKYCIQDSNCLYIGPKYTLNEIADDEEILFKFRKVCAASFRNGSDGEDTLETMLYYLKPDDFRLQILKQMRAKVRVSIIKEKKPLFGEAKKKYVTVYIPVTEMASMDITEKESAGMVISELRVNKLALMTV